MKKAIVLLLSISFLNLSCILGSGSAESVVLEKEDSESEKCTVTFENKTDMAVNVYENYSPYYMTSPTVTVPAGEKVAYETEPSKNKEGTAFFFEYLIDIGSCSFPYWPGDYYSTYLNEADEKSSYGLKTVYLEKNTTETIEIDSLLSTLTKSAYIVVENNTTSEIYLKYGSSAFIPCNKDNKFIKTGSCEIYEVSDDFNRKGQTSFEYSVIDNLKISINEKEISFPVTKAQVHTGNIYTVSVNTDANGVTASLLKLVTPFNLDTQKKIWSKDESFFDTTYKVMMRRSNNGTSTVIMGTPKIKNAYVGYQIVDDYGDFKTDGNNFASFSIGKEINYCEIIDFLEMDDGSFFMLVYVDYDDGACYLLVNYDFANKKLLSYKEFSGSLQFRNDSKNILVKLSDNRIAMAGGVCTFSDDFCRYRTFVSIIDYSDSANLIVSNKISTEYDEKTDYDEKSDSYTAGTERLFSSAYFDGTYLYVCGWENWSPSDYSTTHLGKIYRINPDDFEDSSLEEIYSMENCLFFSIEGNGTDYAVCGEYTDSGKILKGCFVTGKMIEENSSAAPVLTVISGKSYCWFNQMCFYDDKLVLCGSGSSSFDGSKNPQPFVVAYDKNENKLWENLSYTKYTNALNIIPNTIGTYLIQLSGKNGVVHYVNADLLGNEGE